MDYFSKMKGTTKSPPAIRSSEIIWSWIGSFLGIAAVAVVNFSIVDKTDLVMIIGSFGASAVLIYGTIRSPLAQPRNPIGGHLISAAIGVTTFKLLPTPLWLTSAIAVATSIAIMHATKTLHPLGGAKGLVSLSLSSKRKDTN
jgi:CBS-domain-containing membrane protein